VAGLNILIALKLPMLFQTLKTVYAVPTLLYKQYLATIPRVCKCHMLFSGVTVRMFIVYFALVPFFFAMWKSKIFFLPIK